MRAVVELGVRVWIGALEGASIGWHSWWNVLWWRVWIGIVGVMTVSLSVCVMSLPVLLHCCSLYEIELEQQWSDAWAWAYALHRLQANSRDCWCREYAVTTGINGTGPGTPRASNSLTSGTGRGRSPAPTWTPRMSDQNILSYVLAIILVNKKTHRSGLTNVPTNQRDVLYSFLLVNLSITHWVFLGLQ